MNDPSITERPTWKHVLAHAQDPLIYLLLAAIAIALVAWCVEGRSGWPVDALDDTGRARIVAALQAVREGRNSFDNLRKFLRHLLSSNMGEVLTLFLGVVGASVVGAGLPGLAGSDRARVSPATAMRWCSRCWPRRSCGSTGSPTPGPRGACSAVQGRRG